MQYFGPLPMSMEVAAFWMENFTLQLQTFFFFRVSTEHDRAVEHAAIFIFINK